MNELAMTQWFFIGLTNNNSRTCSSVADFRLVQTNHRCGGSLWPDLPIRYRITIAVRSCQPIGLFFRAAERIDWSDVQHQAT